MISEDSRNIFLAIVLSVLVLIGWNYFYAAPQLQKDRQAQTQTQTQGQTPAVNPAAPSVGAGAVGGGAGAVAPPGAAPAEAAPKTLAEALAASPRVAIDTASLGGSIDLTGGVLDDVVLKGYHETIDPKSPLVRLFAPQGGPAPYWAETGFVTGAPGVKTPNRQTLWSADSTALERRQAGDADLRQRRRAEIQARHFRRRQIYVHDPGFGRERRRRAGFAASLRADPAPRRAEGRRLRHAARRLRRRHRRRLGAGSHLFRHRQGDRQGQRRSAATAVGSASPTSTGLRRSSPSRASRSRRAFPPAGRRNSRTISPTVLGPALAIAPGAASETVTRLFAGAKEVSTIDAYETSFGIKKFDLMIDWGWFYFITKPLFLLIDAIYRYVGNFGIAILIVTVLVKLAFFPLANQSYRSMAKMKKIQPQIAALKDLYPDDRQKQQQAQMELFKKEGVNPVAGCLPMVIQIPVFFALYKVIFITIEMRHAPFYGWIKDLSAADPTNFFTLFGLIPWDPTVLPGIGHFLALGLWPLIMGVSMFIQMKMNPEPADPVQKTMFAWMPVIFTFMLGSFPAGLVIYWTWNNTLTIVQQGYIMSSSGVKVELWDNLKKLFVKQGAT